MTNFKFCPLCAKQLIEKNIDNKIRFACTSVNCGFIYWNNPLPVVAALIKHQNKILLIRNKLWPEKIFGLVTGFLEKGETPQDAVLREVKEELGLTAKIIDFIGVYTFFQLNELIIAYYLTTEGEIKLGDEIAEYKLVPSKKLRPWQFGTGQAVSDWLKKYAKST